ncbi:LysR family transcriptional regulator [Asticcacaulis sp. W401b]|uniref:LysR family transcriptional regulator n=1 Tax=Asticcacaulis sp. W401b TaxID=3388666 RepID=UPI003970E4EC
MIKLRRIRVALAIRQTGSAAGAAERLHLSQPSVTEAIARLESDLDTPLFERSSKGMRPTAEGEVFCARSAEAFDILNDAARQCAKGAAPNPTWPRQVNELHLRTVVALSRTGRFTLAAQSLNMAAAAVHRAARELETLSRLTLWRRAPAGITLTPTGEVVARASALTLRGMELAREAMMEQKGVFDGQLRIGVLPLARAIWAPMAIAALLDTYPRARIKIIDGSYAELRHALLDGDVDMVIGALRPEKDVTDIVQYPLFSDPLSVIARSGHPLAGMTAVTPDVLHTLTWALPRPDTPARQMFNAFFSRYNLSAPSETVECGSLAALRGLLSLTDIVTPLSPRQVQFELEAGSLVVIGPPLEGTERSIGLAERKHFRTTQLYNAFKAALVRAA